MSFRVSNASGPGSDTDEEPDPKMVLCSNQLSLVLQDGWFWAPCAEGYSLLPAAWHSMLSLGSLSSLRMDGLRVQAHPQVTIWWFSIVICLDSFLFIFFYIYFSFYFVFNFWQFSYNFYWTNLFGFVLLTNSLSSVDVAVLFFCQNTEIFSHFVFE